MSKNWRKKFFIIYTGQAFSIIGSAAVQFALVWYLTLQTESAMVLTTAAIIGFLPGAFLGPFAGVWIDRYNRRTVMILADGLVALSSLLLAVAFFWYGDLSPAWIYAALFVRGIGTTFHTPAMHAAIPTFVPTEQLTKAGGWGSFISSGSNILGPLLGAFFMGIMPVAVVMLVDVVGAAFAIICLLFVKIPNIPKQEGAQTNFLSEMKQGLQTLKENRLLLAALPQYVCTGILYFPISSLLPLLVLTHYQGGAFHNGLIDTSFATGMLISSILLGVWGGSKKKLMTVSIGIGVLGICSIVISFLPASLFSICILCTFVMGHTAAWFNVPFNAYVQESTPPQDLGKVISLIYTTCTVANPIGLALSGPVSDLIGVNRWFLLSGIILSLAGILCYLRTKKPEQAYLDKMKEYQGSSGEVKPSL